jgi:hypothetical protein
LYVARWWRAQLSATEPDVLAYALLLLELELRMLPPPH